MELSPARRAAMPRSSATRPAPTGWAVADALERALARADHDAAADALARAPRADLSPFLWSAARRGDARSAELLLDRGASLRAVFGVASLGAESPQALLWPESCESFSWPERAGWRLPQDQMLFDAFDAAVFSGSVELAALLERRFPGRAAQRRPGRRLPLSSFPEGLRELPEAPTAAFVAARSAALEGRSDLMEKMLAFLARNGVDPHASDARAGSALTLACQIGHANAALALLSRPDFRPTESGPSPLAACARRGDADLLRLLLEAGESPRRLAPREAPALWEAVRLGRHECARALVEAGARVDFSWQGESMIDFARRSGVELPAAKAERAQIAQTVKEAEASRRKRDKKALAKAKRELAEREGVSLEEAKARLLAVSAPEPQTAGAEPAAAPDSPRRARRL
jgi:hypothetical protein